MRKVALTLRLPPEIYEGVKEMAQKEGKSISGCIGEFLEEKLREKRRKRLFDAFSLVAEDEKESDVEYAFEAQKGVVLGE